MENKHSSNYKTAGTNGTSPGPSLTIDYALYQKYLDNSDLTEAQKSDYLDTLWSIIVSFVDLGFGVHPLQQACEQELDLTSLMATDVVSSRKGLSQNQFTDAADPIVKLAAERKES